jgi:lactococcin 972 family bacteriocin
MSLKRILAAVVLIGALCSTAAAAQAITVNPNEGGTWNYGLSTGVHAYSDYKVGKCHGTTVVNDWGTNRTIDIAANKWAMSSYRATIYTHNKYYYRVC